MVAIHCCISHKSLYSDYTNKGGCVCRLLMYCNNFEIFIIGIQADNKKHRKVVKIVLKLEICSMKEKFFHIYEILMYFENHPHAT